MKLTTVLRELGFNESDQKLLVKGGSDTFRPSLPDLSLADLNRRLYKVPRGSDSQYLLFLSHEQNPVGERSLVLTNPDGVKQVHLARRTSAEEVASTLYSSLGMVSSSSQDWSFIFSHLDRPIVSDSGRPALHKMPADFWTNDGYASTRAILTKALGINSGDISGTWGPFSAYYDVGDSNRREAFVITTAQSAAGSGKLLMSQTKDGPVPNVVNCAPLTYVSGAIAMCAEQGTAGLSVPRILVLARYESSGAINVHRLEAGQILNPKSSWFESEPKLATSYGLFQVIPGSRILQDSAVRRILDAGGLKEWPSLSDPIWQIPSFSTVMSIALFKAWCSNASSKSKTFFHRYVGNVKPPSNAPVGNDDLNALITLGTSPQHFGHSAYNSVTKRMLIERCLELTL